MGTRPALRQGRNNLIPGSARVFGCTGYVCMCTKIRDGCSEIWDEAENHEIPSVSRRGPPAENTLNFLSALRALNSFSESARAAGCTRYVCMCTENPENSGLTLRITKFLQ